MKKHETLLNTFGGGGNLSKSSFLESLSNTHVAGQAARLGFTLAEVLVTLGIIGVVSAMTLPTLIKNHQRQVYVTQLHKVVNELSQAAEKAIQENNAISLDETKYNRNNANAERDFLNDNFKIANNCGRDLTPCFAGSYKRLDGTAFTLQNPLAVVSLASGASVSIYYNRLEYQEDPYWTDSNGVRRYEPDHGYFELQVDVNGAQGPNIVGRDLFYMGLYSDGKVGDSYSGYDYDWALESCQTESGYGVGCLTRIMDDGWKMDY